MEQHPIPRQITSFEFKLVGFLTIKQFIYLLVFVGLGFVVYLIFPIPVLNVFFAIITVSFGAALAFVPVNDRPLDIWIKNLVKRLTSPTQYHYKKNNLAPEILRKNSVYPSDKKVVESHIDSQKKLNSYMVGKNIISSSKKQAINDLLPQPSFSLSNKKKTPPEKPVRSFAPTTSSPKKPFFTGVVRNHKQTPLYGILIYVQKSENQKPLRILKTNVNGVFATFSPLPTGEYVLKTVDSNGVYLFDTMKIKVLEQNPEPFAVESKELI